MEARPVSTNFFKGKWWKLILRGLWATSQLYIHTRVSMRSLSLSLSLSLNPVNPKPRAPKIQHPTPQALKPKLSKSKNLNPKS